MAHKLMLTTMRVLKSSSAQRIDFHLGWINVDVVGLNAIHDHISNKEVTVGLLEKNTDDLPLYLDVENTIGFPRLDYGANPFESAAILHECIHAMHDYYGGGTYFHPRGGSRFTTKSENEAAAYVASSLYYLYETKKPVSAVSNSPIATISSRIAQRIKDRPGAFVTEAEALDLRNAVAKAYGYGLWTVTDADGPPPDRKFNYRMPD